MGLLGRGRYPGSDRKTVDSSFVISTRQFLKSGFLPPREGICGRLTWRLEYQEKPIFLVGIAAYRYRDSRRWLFYFYDPSPRRSEDEFINNNYTIFLETTTPYYGGVRYWFQCPKCGSRSTKLYLPSGTLKFACRRCHGLVYQSQRESLWMRAERRAQKIRTRLGGDVGILAAFPEKPKHMHWSTYTRLRHRAEKAALFAIHESLRILNI